MNVLLTGASSFLSKRILAYNKSYTFETLGRSQGNTYCNDIRNPFEYFYKNYDYVIHIAGKAHDNSDSKNAASQYFDTNYVGTVNLLNALEKSKIKHFVYISSVAVYGLHSGSLVTEKADLLASDPYGLSKLKAEKAIIEWCDKNDVQYTILRLPLLVGSDAPGNLKNMINGIKRGYYFNVDGGKAKKSMVLVDDVAKEIFKAAQFSGIYNLTDGVHPTFNELSSHISFQLDKKKPLNLPLWFAKLIAFFGDLIGKSAPINSVKLKKLTSDLTFDDSLARKVFGWNPTSVLKGFSLSTENK